METSYSSYQKLNKIPRWKLIPRDSDRIEALGAIGVVRCLGFGRQVQRPDYLPTTPRITDVTELRKIATKKWLNREKSDSTIDYFISGLIPRSVMSSGIQYFIDESEKRTQVILDVILLYGTDGELNLDKLLSLVKEDPEAYNLLKTFV